MGRETDVRLEGEPTVSAVDEPLEGDLPLDGVELEGVVVVEHVEVVIGVRGRDPGDTIRGGRDPVDRGERLAIVRRNDDPRTVQTVTDLDHGVRFRLEPFDTDVGARDLEIRLGERVGGRLEGRVVAERVEVGVVELDAVELGVADAGDDVRERLRYVLQREQLDRGAYCDSQLSKTN